MDSTQLRYFLRIFETGSILAASESLGISQPSLSKRLRRLEDELGVTLFDRTTHGVIPTQFGDALAKHAKLMQSEFDSIRAEMTELRNASIGKVHFGASPVVVGGLLPTLTAELWHTHPNFRYSIREEIPDRLIAAVREGGLELALCTAEVTDEDSDLVMEPLFYDHHVIAAGVAHPLSSKDRIELDSLSAFPWILTPNSGVVRRWFDSKFVLEGLTPPLPVVETPSILHITRVLDQGEFLSFMSLNEIQNHIRSGRIHTLNAPDFVMRRTISAVYRARGSISPGARLIVDRAVQIGRCMTGSNRQ
ncbi:MAG: LysR family transcriptional regulator [Azospirillaceae bacterium]